MNFINAPRDELIAHIEKEAGKLTMPGVHPLEFVADLLERNTSLINHAEEVKSEALELILKHRWRPMSEAPRDESVLMLFRDGFIIAGSFDVGDRMTQEPIAWQPLPDPPTDEEMERFKNG